MAEAQFLLDLREFFLVTYHWALKAINTMVSPRSLSLRWLEIITNFNLTVEYRKAKDRIDVNFLSRHHHHLHNNGSHSNGKANTNEKTRTKKIKTRTKKQMHSSYIKYVAETSTNILSKNIKMTTK